jgi:hypothetical protein
MIVQAMGGLCNRLRVTLSYRALHGPIGVVWVPDGEICGARFDDVFCSLPGVTFLSSHGQGEHHKTCDPAPEAPRDWQHGYRQLQLREEYRERWAALRPGVPYSAIHVRRTDHARLAADNPTRDEEFVSFVQHAQPVVYVATDNGTTQAQYLTAVAESGRRPICASYIHTHARQDESGQRNTTLAEAALDLFMCAGADLFLGSRASSFSDAVEMLKRMGGWWS